MVQLMMLPLGTYQTNCYLAWASGSDTCVVIDPGYEPEEIFSKAKLMNKRIEAILLTHGHFDHVGEVEEMALQTGCPVYIHKADYEMPSPLFPLTGKLSEKILFLEDNQKLELSGLEITVLHTPGHTPGSVCFQFEDCLLTGDTLFAGSCGRTDLPGGDWDTISNSLERLCALEGDCDVYPGHGEATTLEKEKKYNPYCR